MTNLGTDLEVEVYETPRERVSATKAILNSLEGRIGLGVGLFMLAIVVFGRFFAPYDPRGLRTGAPGRPPGEGFLLGTDALGRDVLSRVLTGGDTMLFVPLVAITLSMLLGGGLGLLGAYRGGTFDSIITRLFDFLLTIPPLLIVLVVVAGFGTSFTVIIVTLAVVFAPGFGRVVRGVAREVIVLAYVDASRARGESSMSIVGRDVLPNITAPVLAEFSLRTTYAILFVGSLSFLGLGVQPPAPDWGLMVAENRSLLSIAPLATLAPAVAICMLSISFNLLADAVSNHLSRGESSKMVKL
jgi:peptide/nickel transport system permease protein